MALQRREGLLIGQQGSSILILVLLNPQLRPNLHLDLDLDCMHLYHMNCLTSIQLEATRSDPLQLRDPGQELN